MVFHLIYIFIFSGQEYAKQNQREWYFKIVLILLLLKNDHLKKNILTA